MGLPLRFQNAPKADISNLGYLKKYLSGHKRDIIIFIISVMITSSSVLGVGAGVKQFVDEGLIGASAHSLNRALVYLFMLILLLSIGSYGRVYYMTKIGSSIVAQVRRDVYDKVMRLSSSFFDVNQSGEVLSRLNADTTVLNLVIGNAIATSLRNAIICVGGVVMIMLTSPKLALYTSIVVPLIILFVMKQAKIVRQLAKTARDRVAEMSSYLAQSLTAMKVIQSYNREGIEKGNFNSLTEGARKAEMEGVAARARLSSTVMLLSLGAVACVMWMGGKDVLAGDLTMGELSTFIFYAVLVAGAIGSLSNVYTQLQKAAGSTERLAELMQMEVDIKSPSKPQKLPKTFNGKVEFKGVSFAYPTKQESKALDNVSFTVKPGEMIALVGPSGTGKSTVLNMLLRFYDVDEGVVLVGGKDIRKLSVKELREQFAFVPQDPIVFSTSARDNILFGRHDATEEEVFEAAKAAHALEFIEKLPEGFDTALGERGVRLSGGERQRIALARAILRKPKILLLDEATSALDAESESFVQEALAELMKTCTTIVIAHRLATVRKAQKIVVLENGKIGGVGKHSELLKKSPLYKRLADLQFKLPE
jgi:ATP-binding cassette subfamily B protein